jgi:oligopeptidase B
MTNSVPLPPLAPRRPHDVVSPHGVRDDPYYWLRDDDRKDPEVLAYLQAENAYREARLAAIRPLEDRLYEEIVGRIQQDDSTVPYRKSGFWYYVRFEAGQEHPIFARRPDGPADRMAEQILLDGNELARGHEYYRIESLEVSPDSGWLAFCEDTVGRRECTLRFKNLATGEILPVAIPNIESDIVWAADNRTVLYVEKDPETLLGLYVKKHQLGSDPCTDVLVFRQDDLSFYTGVSKSKSDRFIFISMESTVSSEWRYADAADPALQFQTFLPRERDHEYQIEHLGDRFLVRTNWRATNFRLMWAPLDDAGDRSRWIDLEAHRDDTLIEDFDVFDSFIALSVRTGGLRRVRVRPLGPAAGDAFFIDGEEAACTTSIGVNAETDSHILRYSYTSLTTPPSIYDYDVRTGAKTLLKREPVLGAFDPADYVSEFLFAPARDGRQVPVSLVFRRGVQPATAPLLQYGYGAYGLSMDPAFSASRLSLLDRGMVFAIAHVRGGQEMGRAWYDQGRLLAKRNSFTDFVDVTRFLVARGYGAKHRVAAMGGSAGGLLVAAVANHAPEDYRAMVAQVPFVDVVTTMLDDSIPLTTNEYDEWGNPADKAFYDYLLSYSPYDQVAERPYPAMLVTTGLWDSQVQYYEPAKWVAKLRALKAPPRLLVMHVDMEAGHGGKAGRFQRYREVAREYAFILSELGAAE